MPRYWGQKIVIDGSWYETPAGKASAMTIKPPSVPLPGARPVFAPWDDNVVRPTWLKGSKDIYEYDAQEVLRKIDCDPVGAILPRAINESPKTCTLVPASFTDFIQKPGATFARDYFNPCDSTIRYMPYDMPGIGVRARADNVLVHELVHALRQMRGQCWTYPPPLLGFPNREELFAVMVEGIYLTSRGRVGDVRMNYENIPESGSPAELETRYANRYAGEIALFLRQLPDLVRPLGRLSAPFNPLRKAGAGK